MLVKGAVFGVGWDPIYGLLQQLLNPRLVLSSCRLGEAEGIRTMSPRLARHLRDAVPVIVFFVIVAFTWDNVRWYLV